MNKQIGSFKFFGIPVQIQRSALVGSALMALLFAIMTATFTNLTPLDALIAGILATILHWISDLLHQYGHALASKRVGYPMKDLHLWWLLVRPRYPRNEPELPPMTHIIRALGGPTASAGVSVIAALLAVWLIPMGGMAEILGGWFFWENLLVFTIGALFPPVYFPTFNTDGGSILHWWRVQRQQSRTGS